MNGIIIFPFYLKFQSPTIEQIKKEVNQLESSFTDFNKLDFQIKITEIHKAISSLKNKSAGIDGLCNEMFKSAQSYIDKCLLKINNAVVFRELSQSMERKLSCTYI